MESDNIKVDLYSVLRKPKNTYAELENDFAGNDDDFIVSILRFCLGLKTTRKLVVRNNLLQGIVWKLEESYETCNKVWGFHAVVGLRLVSNTRIIYHIGRIICYNWDLNVCGKFEMYQLWYNIHLETWNYSHVWEHPWHLNDWT